MARISEFMRFPDIHHHEIAAIYRGLRDDAFKMLQHLTQWCAVVDLSTSSRVIVAYARYQAACSLIIPISLILNSLLRAFDPTNSSCVMRLVILVTELQLSQSVSCHRPVGSRYAPVCLLAAWTLTDNAQQLTRIETIWAEYQPDFIGFNWADRAIWLRSTFDTLCQRAVKGDYQNSFATRNDACVIL